MKPPMADAQSNGNNLKNRQKTTVPTSSSGYLVHKKNARFALRLNDLFFRTPPLRHFLRTADNSAHMASGVSQTI